ncbi:MAG: hypothetical protein EBQ79_03655 [Actinobacteria bacterium]|nr:hypothetical protein [Actinomycetota bacterium]
MDLNQFQADAKNIKLTVNAPEGLVVLGDAELLTMALKNLIENAIVYSNEDTQVGIGLREVDNFAEVTVTDNGLGIPLDQQERIFERFYRVDPSRSRDRWNWFGFEHRQACCNESWRRCQCLLQSWFGFNIHT